MTVNKTFMRFALFYMIFFLLCLIICPIWCAIFFVFFFVAHQTVSEKERKKEKSGFSFTTIFGPRECAMNLSVRQLENQINDLTVIGSWTNALAVESVLNLQWCVPTSMLLHAFNMPPPPPPRRCNQLRFSTNFFFYFVLLHNTDSLT
jgi:hypothetical protein